MRTLQHKRNVLQDGLLGTLLAQGQNTPRRSAGGAHTPGAGEMTTIVNTTTISFLHSFSTSTKNKKTRKQSREKVLALSECPKGHFVPPGVCSSWPLLTVWDPQFSRAHRQRTTHTWSLLEYAAPGRSSQSRTRGFPRLTANPQHSNAVFSARISSVNNTPEVVDGCCLSLAGFCTLRLGVGFQSSTVSTTEAPAATMSSTSPVDRQCLYHHTECIDDAQLHHRSSFFHLLPDDDNGSLKALCNNRP